MMAMKEKEDPLQRVPCNQEITNMPLLNQKSRRAHCVFNQTRESFLSLNVAIADTHFARLRGLAGRLRFKTDEGLWVKPSRGIHTIGVLFAIDLIYLDADYRVLHVIESFPTFRIGPIRRNCASVLELPTRTIYSSHTRVGDVLVICRAEEMEQGLTRASVTGSIGRVAVTSPDARLGRAGSEQTSICRSGAAR